MKKEDQIALKKITRTMYDFQDMRIRTAGRLRLKAETVSKMWQFAGLNPGMVRGKIRKQKKGKDFTIELSNEMIRGDKKKVGFISPYNIWLRTKLCGVIAGNFIINQNEYALKYYYPYKERLQNEKRWQDKTPAHIDKAAKRYMIKMFLKDLYVAWRTYEGLPIRKPYQEEYLGHIHNEPTSVKNLHEENEPLHCSMPE